MVYHSGQVRLDRVRACSGRDELEWTSDWVSIDDQLIGNKESLQKLLRLGRDGRVRAGQGQPANVARQLGAGATAAGYGGVQRPAQQPYQRNNNDELRLAPYALVACLAGLVILAVVLWSDEFQ